MVDVGNDDLTFCLQLMIPKSESYMWIWVGCASMISEGTSWRPPALATRSSNQATRDSISARKLT